MSEDRELGRVEAWKMEARKKYASVKTIQPLAKHMKAMGDLLEEAKDQASRCQAFYDVLRLELVPALMEEQDVEKITIAGLGRVQLASDLHVKIPPGKAEAFFDWLRENDMGDLIKETVNSSSLKSFAKSRIQAGKETPSELLNVTPFTRASIVKG